MANNDDSNINRRERFVDSLKSIERTYCKLIRHYNWSIRSSRNMLKKCGTDEFLVEFLVELVHTDLHNRYLVKQDLLRVRNKISKFTRK